MKENAVKEICKELNITQKELAKEHFLSENTISQWARGVNETPKWAKKLFELLKIERKFNTIKQALKDEL